MTTRRRLLQAAAACAGFGGACALPAAKRVRRRWDLYASRFIQADGRVIDDQHETRYTTSEGQAYSLFHALVVRDRERFDALLEWTRRHLCDGDLETRLPGWRWGRREDGNWTIIDRNPATDADLWLAHTLFEASRIWREPRHRKTALSLLALVRDQEVIDLPGIGPMLLPGPLGFVGPHGSVRLNPSYFAIHQLLAFAREDPRGPWNRIARSIPAFLKAACPRGLAPDWVTHSHGVGFHADASTSGRGGYDAIRVYLWTGLLHPDDRTKPELMRILRGMLDLVAARPAELPRFVDAATGQVEDEAPGGFSAALLPYLHSAGRRDLVIAQRARFERLDAMTRPPTYYDQVLALFGLGALEGAFRFDAEGRVIPA